MVHGNFNDHAAEEARLHHRYEPILPQHGHFASHVLGLELAVDGDKLRFYCGDAPVPEAEELIGKLEGMVDGLQLRVDDAERRAQARLRQEAERKLQEVLREIERLKGK